MTDTLKVDVPPRVSRACFEDELFYFSDAVALACYDAILEYGLDPAIGLAFFEHESGFGQYGVARWSHNWGNIRAAGSWLAHHDGDLYGWLVYEPRPGEANGWFWVRSAADWGQLIRELYIDRWGLHDTRAMLEKYAPSGDGNSPHGYNQCVIRSVERWAKQYPPGPTTEERLDDLEGRVAAIEAFLANWEVP
jgi:hypothetical protein